MPWGDIIPFAAILLAFAVILSYAYAYSHPIEKPCPVVYSNLSNLTSNQTANNSKNITIKLGLPANTSNTSNTSSTTKAVKAVKATVTPAPKPTPTPTPTPKPTATPQWVRVLFFTQPGCSICAQDDPVMNQLMMSGYHVTYLTPQNNSDMFKQFGVSTTPTIVVNGDKGARTIYGVVTYDQVVATINEVY